MAAGSPLTGSTDALKHVLESGTDASLRAELFGLMSTSSTTQRSADDPPSALAKAKAMRWRLILVASLATWTRYWNAPTHTRSTADVMVRVPWPHHTTSGKVSGLIWETCSSTILDGYRGFVWSRYR